MLHDDIVLVVIVNVSRETRRELVKFGEVGCGLH